MAKNKPDNAIKGSCGEHYIAAYLSGCGLIVAMPRGGMPGFDLFVTREKSGHAFRIQVKTGTQAIKNHKDLGSIYLWATSYKVIDLNDPYLWYAYVWLRDWPNGEKTPEVFFVPSSVVVACMKGCQADGDTWPYFWLHREEAEQYRGHRGLAPLLMALEPTTA